MIVDLGSKSPILNLEILEMKILNSDKDSENISFNWIMNNINIYNFCQDKDKIIRRTIFGDNCKPLILTKTDMEYLKYFDMDKIDSKVINHKEISSIKKRLKPFFYLYIMKDSLDQIISYRLFIKSPKLTLSTVVSTLSILTFEALIFNRGINLLNSN